ncbi:phage major capsid protein [Sphingobium sp. LSP13-1-1.1]|uniref:phage major capsid protein n=1 Tax=Sphingobium sp. LSP13-1-1.1 TaxID=3135234 RepID=UPI003441CC04
MSDETDKTDAVVSAFEEFKSTYDAKLEETGQAITTLTDAVNNLTAAVSNVEETVDTVAEEQKSISVKSGRIGAPAIITKSNWGLELRNYVATGLNTRAVTTQTGANAGVIGAAGGYLVPEEFDKNLITLAQDVAPLLAEVDVQSTSTPDVKIHVDLGGTGSSWVDETGTNGLYDPTNTPSFAEVSVPFGTLFAKPLISHYALNDAYFDVEALVTDRVATKFAKEVASSIINGTGVNQPKGLLTHTTAATADSVRAFGTIQYIASGQAAALPAANTYANKYIDMVTALNPIYRANAKWYAPRSVVGELRKVQDANGNYMWQQSLVLGQPSSFLGFPVVEVEDIPGVAAGSLSLIFGDLKQAYRVYDLVGTTMLRDPYSYDAYIALKTSKRFGGTGANTEAVKVMKIAAS